MTLFISSQTLRDDFRRIGRYLGLSAIFVLLAGKVHAQTSGQAWRDHLTSQEVISALGEPEGDTRNGATERMLFKGNLLIVLTNNEVTSIEGTVPDALKPVAAPPPVAAVTPAPAPATPATTTSPAPAPPAASTPVPTPTPTASTSTTSSTPTASSASTDTYTGSQNDQDSEKVINDFSTTSIVPQGTTMSATLAKAFGPGADGAGDGVGTAGLPKGLAALAGSTPAATGSPWSTEGTWQWFVAGLLIKTVIMTLVLKGAFAYKEFPVLWREAGLVAAGVSLCNQVLAWLFSMNDFGKIASMVQADQIVAGAVLLALIMHFTEAKSFPTAAGIMMKAMVANIAVGYAQMFFF